MHKPRQRGRRKSVPLEKAAQLDNLSSELSLMIQQKKALK
jgi:hypothetical protein